MRSSELARLAGVSVRALRHYHQVGVLAEPERSGNGYRRYDVHDLIRVLRIRRLASLGVPLDRMPAVLDDASEDAGPLLDELDTELARQVERLTRQRELIARLREHRTAPDLPPELAPFLAAFAAVGQPPELARVDREQVILLAHIAGEEGIPRLTRLYRRLSEATLAPAIGEFSERFGRLGPDSGDAEITALADAFVALFAPLLAEFAADDTPIDFEGSASLLATHTADVMNEQQRRTLALIEERLSETG